MINNANVSVKENEIDKIEYMGDNEDNPNICVKSECDNVENMINYLASQSNISFKSQQLGEDDLTEDDKKNIARTLYSKSVFQFLTKFGSHLTQNHLDFIEVKSAEDVNTNFIITQLKNLLRNRKLITKNRRYEALLQMVEEDKYFSEKEMMKRNPLLYDQLVGRYLSEDEKRARDHIDTVNITLLGVLMEGVDKQITKNLMEDQKRDEDLQMDKSDDEDDESSSDEKTHNLWGEFSNSKPTSFKYKKAKEEVPMITSSERSLLRDEFIQEMYRSFLAGEDRDFNYDEVDNNTQYDSVVERGRDEEEKYFDSETPEEPMDQILSEEKRETMNEESEDELDVYMRHLNNHKQTE